MNNTTQAILTRRYTAAQPGRHHRGHRDFAGGTHGIRSMKKDLAEEKARAGTSPHLHVIKPGNPLQGGANDWIVVGTLACCLSRKILGSEEPENAEDGDRLVVESRPKRGVSRRQTACIWECGQASCAHTGVNVQLAYSWSTRSAVAGVALSAIAAPHQAPRDKHLHLQTQQQEVFFGGPKRVFFFFEPTHALPLSRQVASMVFGHVVLQAKHTARWTNGGPIMVSAGSTSGTASLKPRTFAPIR